MRRIAIVCTNINRAIGFKNDLIFNIPCEWKIFKKHTLSQDKNRPNVVLMGRKTFESIKCKPLPKRMNIVISSSSIELESMYRYDNLKFFYSIEESLIYLEKNKKLFNDLFVCGGKGIYEHFVTNNLLDLFYLSEITGPENNLGDVFLTNTIDFVHSNYKKIYNENHDNRPAVINHDETHINVDYTFSIFYNPLSINSDFNQFLKKTVLSSLPYIDIESNTNHPENQYLYILNDVLQWGRPRDSRNSITLSKFGKTMEFDISKSFPLLTTKRVFWKGVLHELLWFIKADTNADNLSEKGVKIWDGNTTREYLDSIGLEKYNIGECGPIYGFQWRHFNAKYNGCSYDYTGKGVDQLQNIVDLINNNPTSRRMFMSGWNPEQLNEMCLPPCHVSYQFYVDINTTTKEKTLSCSMYQRSGDLFLGVPFNIASTAALTYIVANLTKCKPGKIIINIGDAHIYKDHINAVQEQLKRDPKQFPTLEIKGKHLDLESYKYEDFVIHDYSPHPTIKADMIA